MTYLLFLWYFGSVMKIKGFILSSLLALLLSACAAGSGHHLPHYSQFAFQYKSKPTEQSRALYKAALQAVLNDSALNRTKVPPGIYAELAFLELEEKKRDQAAFYLNQEQQLYPESATIVRAWLNRIEAGAMQ